LAVVIALAGGLICLVVSLLLRGPSQPTREKPTRISPDSEAKHAEKPEPLPGSRTAETAQQARTSFGVLVWPGMTGRAMNYSRQILSWMKEWGFDAGFVTAREGGGEGEPSSRALPADVAGNAWPLSEVSSKLNAIVAADGDLSDSQAVALKEYIISGGWLIMPSPEDGGASPEIEDLLQLKPSRSATLMAPESPHALFSFDPLGPEEVRATVSHPVTSGLDAASWLEWTGPAGKALYSKADNSLPLLCFRRPELPAVRLIAFGEGGVVHLNFPLRPGPLIEDIELKSFLGQTLTWLWGRASWAKPVEKEGTIPGIVRKKDGTAIPAAKVTAKVFSESGEAAQTLEATSSEDGEFSLSLSTMQSTGSKRTQKGTTRRTCTSWHVRKRKRASRSRSSWNRKAPSSVMHITDLGRTILPSEFLSSSHRTAESPLRGKEKLSQTPTRAFRSTISPPPRHFTLLQRQKAGWGCRKRRCLSTSEGWRLIFTCNRLPWSRARR
jgi:hypothetical protein